MWNAEPLIDSMAKPLGYAQSKAWISKESRTTTRPRILRQRSHLRRRWCKALAASAGPHPMQIQGSEQLGDDARLSSGPQAIVISLAEL